MHIRAIRGILAIVVLLAIFFYTLLNVIFWPIKEAALSPVKEYRIAGDEPFDLLKKTINPGWRVTYVRLTHIQYFNNIACSTSLSIFKNSRHLLSNKVPPLRTLTLLSQRNCSSLQSKSLPSGPIILVSV